MKMKWNEQSYDENENIQPPKNYELFHFVNIISPSNSDLSYNLEHVCEIYTDNRFITNFTCITREFSPL